MATAIYEKGDDNALHLLRGSSLPQPLRDNLEGMTIPLDWDWFVAIAARTRAEITVKLNNHDDVPGAHEAGFSWATFRPRFHPDTGELVGVWARYE